MAETTNFNNAVAQAMGIIGEKVTDTMIDTLISKGKLATGQLVQGIQHTETFDQQDEQFVTTIKIPGYGKYVNEGRRPGAKMPPIEEGGAGILPWVMARRIKTPGLTQRQLAWAIAKSIAKKGIRPTPFIEDSIEFALTNFQDEIRAGAVEGLTKDLAVMLEFEFPDAKITTS